MPANAHAVSTKIIMLAIYDMRLCDHSMHSKVELKFHVMRIQATASEDKESGGTREYVAVPEHQIAVEDEVQHDHTPMINSRYLFASLTIPRAHKGLCLRLIMSSELLKCSRDPDKQKQIGKNKGLGKE
ncbi:uncharacterized protein MELLADRAFT_108122 [Melampsora larici-populina 98AG31]|uniref:Uncharacterized protein n=1 Tax=Melampsora larici-populina (strain 98AG31 / pathotype 3-4-7) TaxID=747676 RepID=F4RS16_MELLP|nr:uncharacterized protein MELLADRAFT_108122 [Melampsora larici-populina 98AG31]EGG04855.1 hypothetical protein MELLADRAFT_108122 [Melampsora larici-populina 98AG31]